MLFEGGTNAILFDTSVVKIEISDQVKDGCMPQPSALETAAEAALRRNGFGISTDENALFIPTVRITALGYAVGGNSCAVTFTMQLSRFIAAIVPNTGQLPDDVRKTLAPIDWTVYNKMLTGPKYDMQGRLEREAEKSANELFIAVDRANDYVKEKWPVVWEANN